MAKTAAAPQDQVRLYEALIAALPEPTTKPKKA